MTEILNEDTIKNTFPTSEIPNNKTNDVAYTIEEVIPKNVTYTYLTGRFSYRSSRGNEYILVGCHYDGNAILAEPMKNRTAATITEAWDSINNKFSIAGIQSRTYILDNKVSQQL